MPRSAEVVLLLFGALSGCKSHSSAGSSGAAAVRVGTTSGAAATGAGGEWRTESVFSAPIAAARVGGRSVVAGLVAAESLVRVVASGPNGGPGGWTADVLRGVKWSEATQLSLRAAGDGVLVTWGDGTAKGGAATWLGADGTVRGEQPNVGAATCATADAVAWLDWPGKEGRLLTRAWAEPSPVQATALTVDHTYTLVCGDRSLFVIDDGDDDVTVSTVDATRHGAGKATTLLRSADFSDEEREHDAFTVGDDLFLARIGDNGTVALRSVGSGGPPRPWRKLSHALGEDDDVVAVDGQGAHALVVFTRDSEKPCAEGESAGQQVRAFDVDLAAGHDVALDLAAADCKGQRGPFWIASAPAGDGLLLSWVERAGKLAGGAAPVVSLAYRVVRGGGVQSGQRGVAADAVVDAGCDKGGCYAAALVRPPGGDGMQPESVVVFQYP